MASDSNNSDNPKKKDLTRIQDLSEFLHQDDPETDAILDDESPEQDDFSEAQNEGEDLPFTDDLESDFSEMPQQELGDEEEDSFSGDFTSEDNFNDNSEEVHESDEEDFQSDLDGDFSSDLNPEFGEPEFGEENTPDFEQEDSFESFSDNQDFAQEHTSDEDENHEMLPETPDLPDVPDDFRSLEDDTKNEKMDKGDEEAKAQTKEEVEELDDIEDPFPTSKPLTPRTSVPATSPLQEIRTFGSQISYGKVAAGGNPPFSIAMRNIIYKEDAEDILIILREFNLVDDTNETQYRDSLERGVLLISQLSEFSAIYLAHRLRRFDLDLQIGLSEEIHPSKSYDKSEQRGLVTRQNFRKNTRQSLEIAEEEFSIDDILVTTETRLVNYEIIQYRGVITENILIDSSDIENLISLQTLRLEQSDEGDNVKESESEQITKKLLSEISEVSNNESDNENSSPPINIDMDHSYQQLILKAKQKAFAMGANAVLGLHFQTTPLPHIREGENQKYKLTCLANAAVVSKN